LINAIASGLVGQNTAIFNELELKKTDLNNIDTGLTTNHKKYSKDDPNKPATIKYTVAVKAGEPTYMYIPTDYPREVKLSVSSKPTGSTVSTTYFGNKTDHVMYLGIFDQDQDITVTLEYKSEAFYIRNNEKYFFSMDTTLFDQTFSSLASGNMDITLFEEDYIEGTVTVSEGQSLLYTSIVFDEGWIITVDGEEKELIMTNDSLIAVEIEPGEHTITMRYLPKCYTVGGTVSIIGIVAFITAIVIDEVNKRRELRKWAKENYIL
jgi:uncharacterized membrane protein YfhO